MKVAFFTLLTFVSFLCKSQINVVKDSNAVRFANSITAADLKEYLNVLASEEYEGRATGEKGQKMAAEYISTHFSEFGLTAIDKNQNYLQEFDLVSLEYKSAKINNGKLYEDFLFYGLENLSIINSNFVFAGYGIKTDKYNNYEGIDVNGKVVLFLDREPTFKGKSIITGTQELSEWGLGNTKKTELAKQLGATKSIIINTESLVSFQSLGSRLKHYYEHPALVQKNEKRETRLSVTTKFAAKLLNISEKKFSKIIAKLNKSPIINKKVNKGKISIELKIEEAIVPTENVIGMVGGTDLADEVIVISAHYDHIGIKNGKVYNGADDDGSGTVAVMELAQAFAEAKKAGFGPRRSIVFIGMTGEEKGLLGSEYYSENPIIPLENTVTNLNIDMIGRLDENYPKNENYVYLIGTNMLSQELHDISEETNKTYKGIGLDYRFNSLEDENKFYYRSDHYNFAKHGIPVIFYFNGVHEDYHKHTDTVDKILFNKIENITQLVFYTAWEIANRNERPKIDKTDSNQ